MAKEMLNISGTGKAHGKLILMGEHSVVYDKLSVGIPFMAVSISVTITETKSPSYLDSSLYKGPLNKIPYFIENIFAVYKALKADLNIEDKNFKIHVESNIPVERGLGSSAAIAVALVRAFENYVAKEFETEKFLTYVDLSEKISHGNPSGLDARLISLEQPLLYQKSKPIQNFYFHTPFWLTIIDTGITGQTKSAVSDVRSNFESPYYARSRATQLTIDKLDELAKDFYYVLEHEQENFSRLAEIINSAHEQLRTLQVSSPEQDYGIKFALENGAAAGKITGGGRGGCFYVLSENEASASKIQNLMLENQLGVDAWITPLSSIDMGKEFFE